MEPEDVEVGVEGRTSSILPGESDMGEIRLLQAAMIDKGDAHRFERHDAGAFRDRDLLAKSVGQPRVFKYDRPKLARGEMLVDSIDDADDTLDLGDQTSESLAESLAVEEGGVRDTS